MVVGQVTTGIWLQESSQPANIGGLSNSLDLKKQRRVVARSNSAGLFHPVLNDVFQF